MLFFTPRRAFYLKKLSDRSYVWFQPGTIYCQSALEFVDLNTTCPGMSLIQRIKYLIRDGWVTITEPKNIEDLIKCVLFNESIK
jgi:hypothetical protein